MILIHSLDTCSDWLLIALCWSRGEKAQTIFTSGLVIYHWSQLEFVSVDLHLTMCANRTNQFHLNNKVILSALKPCMSIITRVTLVIFWSSLCSRCLITEDKVKMWSSQVSMSDIYVKNSCCDRPSTLRIFSSLCVCVKCDSWKQSSKRWRQKSFPPFAQLRLIIALKLNLYNAVSLKIAQRVRKLSMIIVVQTDITIVVKRKRTLNFFSPMITFPRQTVFTHFYVSTNASFLFFNRFRSSIAPERHITSLSPYRHTHTHIYISQ